MPDPRWSTLGDELYAELSNLCDQAAAAIGTLTDSGALVLCHGDLQPTNVLVDASDRVWLIDFEYACLAPAEWDPAKLLILARRFGDPAQVDELLAAWPATLDRLASLRASPRRRFRSSPGSRV